MYGNKRMNWMSKHGTLKLMPTHINTVLVETWEDFKLSSNSITQNDLKNTHITPLSPPDKVTNRQAYIAATQVSKGRKANETESTENVRIVPTYMEEIRTTEPMVFLRDKGRVRPPSNLLIRASAYDTVMNHTVLPLQ